MNEDPNSAFYLYGFTRSDQVPNGAASQPPQTASISPAAPGTRIVDVAGIDERHPPFYWGHGDLAAILSLVAREEFCGPVAEIQLQDLAWLSPRVCQHQAVLEEVMNCAPILPARFGTLFSSTEALSQFMERHRKTIGDFLERAAGQEEWAVKGLLDRARAEDELCRQIRVEDKVPLASSPGLAYMQEQRLRVKAKQSLDDWLAKECSALVEELTLLASETCQRQVLSRSPREIQALAARARPGGPISRGETTGADQEMVFNWAFLVPQGAGADFQKQVEHVNASGTPSGLTFAVSGPWPPFSFCPALEAEPA